MTDPSVILKQLRNGHRTTAKKRIKVVDELISGYDPEILEIKGKLKSVVVTLQGYQDKIPPDKTPQTKSP